jgi:hypothetical protein
MVKIFHRVTTRWRPSALDLDTGKADIEPEGEGPSHPTGAYEVETKILKQPIPGGNGTRPDPGRNLGEDTKGLG